MTKKKSSNRNVGTRKVKGTAFRGRRKRSEISTDRSTKKMSPKHAMRVARKKKRLANLPKNHWKRFLWYLKHPGAIFKYWFSREGGRMLFKIFLGFIGICVLALAIFWIVVRAEMKALSPEELARRVQTTTTKYLDRNGELLWEDTGTGNYRLVVDSDQISIKMKMATVAIEDKTFYEHGGVSIAGIVRSLVNNLGGGGLQGGSTLTQQLVKQVFFYDESQSSRGLSQIPRKIKEVMLATEAERIYNKDQILTMYLNESPYGGRRNGVESAAQTYFGKSASELNLAESALLAGIPQSPSIYNPYNYDYNPSLIEKQQIVLDYMLEQGDDLVNSVCWSDGEARFGNDTEKKDDYVAKCIENNKITAEQINAAKEFAILDTIKAPDVQMTGAKAPHFVQMVKGQLEDTLGINVVGKGGLTVTTTLDMRAQNIMDAAMDDVFNGYLPGFAGFDNAASTMIDNQTGQILAMRGSRDYNYPEYGAVNSATAFIQPGSSIKPEIYAALIDQKEPNTYGAGSILVDEPLPQSLYPTGNGRSVVNADGRFKGPIPIRQSLGESRNIPVIKAMAEVGRDQTLEKVREIGDTSYCTDGIDRSVGLAASIGGCGVKQVEHVNAFATFARGGVYKSYSSIIKIDGPNKEVLYEHDNDEDSKQVLDPQTAYIISDILTDANARTGTLGYCPLGMCIPGIKTATKTGTTDIGGMAKDLWMMSYSTKVSVGVWYGNHIPAQLRNGSSLLPGQFVSTVMSRTHNEIFAPDGEWKSGDWFQQPQGIQVLNINGRNDIYPSWFKKQNIQTVIEPTIFDKISKRLATDCTPALARETLDVIKTTDLGTNTVTYKAPDGYTRDEHDDVHTGSCKSGVTVGSITATVRSDGKYDIQVQITNPSSTGIQSIAVTVDGKTYTANRYNGSDYYYRTGPISDTISPSSDKLVLVKIVDNLLYEVGTDQPINQSVEFPAPPVTPPAP